MYSITVGVLVKKLLSYMCFSFKPGVPSRAAERGVPSRAILFA